jgi:hypothetical protein
VASEAGHCIGSHPHPNQVRMTTSRHRGTAVLVVAIAIAGCGGDEPASRTPPQARPTAPANANVAIGRVPVGCVAKWTSGETGTFVCEAGGPNKAKVKIDKDSFRLEEICVNDVRIATYGFAGGQSAPLGGKDRGAVRCAQFAGTTTLPETCTCVPAPGGDCKPPPNGFVCLATGYVQLVGP